PRPQRRDDRLAAGTDAGAGLRDGAAGRPAGVNKAARRRGPDYASDGRGRRGLAPPVGAAMAAIPAEAEASRPWPLPHAGGMARPMVCRWACGPTLTPTPAGRPRASC